MFRRYFLLLMLLGQDNTPAPPLHKITRFMDYQDPMNPSIKKIYNLHSLQHIYFHSFSIKYHCIFSKKGTHLSIRESPNPPKRIFNRYRLLVIMVKKNE